MTGHRNRRQHTGAAHRRTPQSGFDPLAYLSNERQKEKFTDFIPTTFSTINILPLPSPTSTTTSQPVLPPTTTTSTTQSSTTTSSSTSTSSVPTPTTTSSTPVVVPSTTQSTPVVTTTGPPTIAIVTNTYTSSNTAAAASVSPSTSSVAQTTSSQVSTGAMAGGIVAGIIAILAVILAIVFFIRRSRKRDSFNEVDFRRSAMILNDPPTHDDIVARGFNPPPPVMLERQTASPAPTFGTKYGYPGGEYAANNAAYGANVQSFGPGQIHNANMASAHPMYTPQSPYEQYHPQNVPYPVLKRQGSNVSSEAPTLVQSPTQMKRESMPANDYVDLSRSSVSPFQAAQYVEISRRLNAEVPEGLRTSDIDRDLPPLPPPEGNSPFTDPSSAPPSPGAQYATDRRNVEPVREKDNEQDQARPISTDSFGTNEQTLDFPVPPSPVMPPTSRYRIESMPPMLPEINLESRASVGGYPQPSARDNGAPTGMLTPGLASASGSRFPTTPSPLASSFGMPSPLPAAAFPSEAPPTPRTPPAVPQNPKKRETSYSMYDPEDAYGGI